MAQTPSRWFSLEDILLSCTFTLIILHKQIQTVHIM
jgi:hypothetical protein